MKDTVYKIIFLGTPEIGVKTLKTLAQNPRFQVLAVITQPDKPQGRKQILTPSEIKKTALSLNIPVFQPEKLNKDINLIEYLESLKSDFLLTFAYGQILNERVLKIPSIKAVNIHGSLLPKYRGASPIEESLLSGDQETGISIMEMIKEMDAGNVFFGHKLAVEENDNSQTLREKISTLSAEKISLDLIEIAEKNLSGEKQKKNFASFCHKIEKNSGLINFKIETADQILNKFRAYFNWPGIFFEKNGKKIKIHSIKLNQNSKITAGQIKIENNQILIGTTTNSLELLEIQMEGKQKQDSKSFINGYRTILEN